MRSKQLVASLSLVAIAFASTAIAGVALAPNAAAAGSNSLTVKAGEYTYKVSGSPKSGWTEIIFDNAGVEFHMLGMAQLKKGVTVKQLTKALESEDENAANALVVGDGTVAPLPGFLGPNEKTTLMTKLAAGHYGIFCFFPAPDGRTHLAHGMVGTLDVSSGKSSLTPPKDGVVDVTIGDDGITLPTSGLPRSGWAKVTNSTSVSRSLILARYLSPTATYEQGTAYFDQYFQTGKVPAGDPPAAIAGGVTSVAPGSSAYFQLALKADRYVLTSSNDEVDDDPNELHVDFTVK
jgi:hypothetical protein